MSDQESTTIEFPCDYPIKVMGIASEELLVVVKNVMGKHDSEFREDTISIRESRKQNYQSVSVMITATGEQQLQDIFNDLKASELVKMVL